jgi:hypothetical protein
VHGVHKTKRLRVCEAKDHAHTSVTLPIQSEATTLGSLSPTAKKRKHNALVNVAAALEQAKAVGTLLQLQALLDNRNDLTARRVGRDLDLGGLDVADCVHGALERGSVEDRLDFLGRRREVSVGPCLLDGVEAKLCLLNDLFRFVELDGSLEVEPKESHKLACGKE